MATSRLHDAVIFAESLLNCELWSLQEKLLHALESSRRVAVKACHASGKSYCAAVAALWFAARHKNARVITLAPGWLTTRTVLWSEIHSLLQRARLRLPTTVQNQTEIRFGADNLIIGLSTNDAARLQGHHAEHVLIIADEAPGIDLSFWPAVEGILASSDSRLLILGNPVNSSGYFYESFKREGWTTFTISAFDTPNLRGLTLEKLLALPDAEFDQNVCPFLATRRWVHECYAEWFNGSVENSPLWQSRVLGEFPSSGSNALIPRDWLEAAQRHAEDTPGEIVCGIDPAGPGKDKTAGVAVRSAAIVDSMTSSARESQGEVLVWLKALESRGLNIRLVRYDSCGLGYFYAEPLREAGFRCEGVNVACAATDPDRFSNAKSENYWNLRSHFQAGAVSGLSAAMLSELAPIAWLIDPRGRTAVEGKDEVRSVLGHSPDLAEALMLALGAAIPVIEFMSLKVWEQRRARPARRAEDQGWMHGTIGRGQHLSRRWRGAGF